MSAEGQRGHKHGTAFATYRIVRFYQTDPARRRTIRRGLTLAEAQAHCQDPETSSSTCKRPENRARTEAVGRWFDGYEREYEKAFTNGR